MLYFDHSASTPPLKEVIETMAEVMEQHYANPDSIHQAGRQAGQLIERSRQVLADVFRTAAKEWIFTSGGTESNNLAIRGAAYHYAKRGKHLVTTQIEHPSVYEVFRKLEQEGFRVTYLPVSATGHVRVEQVQAALTDETSLVSIMHVNNEIGSVQPIAEIGELLRAYPKTLFHVDGVQAIGKLPIQLRGWGIDLYSVSAHKVRGPKGVGLLYAREGVQLDPQLAGGAQEMGCRAGTPNVPGIVAAAKAMRIAMQSQPSRARRMRQLRERLIGSLLAELPQLALSGSPALDNAAAMAPHIIHYCYPGFKGEVLVHALEQQGVVASTKSACSSKLDEPSRVLLAIGQGPAAASAGIRFSLGDEHNEQHIDALAQSIRAMVDKLSVLERGSN